MQHRGRHVHPKLRLRDGLEEAAWVIVAGRRRHGILYLRVNADEAPPNSYDANAIQPSLTNTTAENFTIREMSGDKAYLSADNLTPIERRGATPYIPFTSNSVLGSTPLWDKMFHYLDLRREEFLAHYHKRSNVESTFSAMKRKLGDAVRSRTDTAMKNEVLAKVVCHNLMCPIQERYELGIDPTHWGMPARTPDGDCEPMDVLQFPGQNGLRLN